MKILCECGHPQVLHMGPSGPCRVTSVSDIITTTKRAKKMIVGVRCPCTAFVPAPERERADLG